MRGVPSTPLDQEFDFLNKILLAGLTYFAIVMGTGFVLGVIRVLLLVPRMGERWAELAEMPIMACVIYAAAGYILRRFPEIRSASPALAAGCLAFVLALAAELGLALVLEDQTLGEFLASRDRVSGSVYLLLLGVFAVLPRWRLQRLKLT